MENTLFKINGYYVPEKTFSECIDFLKKGNKAFSTVETTNYKFGPRGIMVEEVEKEIKIDDLQKVIDWLVKR